MTTNRGKDSRDIENASSLCDRTDTISRLLGRERMKEDMRQFGGLLIILGIGASHSALALKAVLVEGMSGASQVDGFKLPALCATIIQTGLGMVAMGIGFYTLIWCPMSSRAHFLAKVLVFVVNLGPISFVITVWRIAQGATEPPENNEFIPPYLNPTESDIKFVVSMGIISLVSVCGTLVGGLTVVGLNLCAYLGMQPMDKHKSYYRLRFAYYSLLVMLGGVSQLLLGVFLGLRFGWGPYDEAVHVAVYTVFFPSLSIVVGFVQTIFGLFGWFRAVVWTKQQSDDTFLYASLANWILTMILQVMVQPSYGKGSSFDAEGATYAAVYLGFFIMPPWLDHMVRKTALQIDPTFFGLPTTANARGDLLCKLFNFPQPRPISDGELTESDGDGCRSTVQFSDTIR